MDVSAITTAGVLSGDGDAEALNDAVRVAGTDCASVACVLKEARGVEDGTTIAPPTLKPSVAELAVHVPLEDLKLQGSVHG